MDYAADSLLPLHSSGVLEIMASNDTVCDVSGRILRGAFYEWSGKSYFLEARRGTFDDSHLVTINAYLVLSRDDVSTAQVPKLILDLRPVGPGFVEFRNR